MLDLQPITLTRLLDRLAENGLIERSADPNDRRANRLYLTPAAKPLLERLNILGADMMETVLEGLDQKTIERMLTRPRTGQGQFARAPSPAIRRNSKPPMVECHE